MSGDKGFVYHALLISETQKTVKHGPFRQSDGRTRLRIRRLAPLPFSQDILPGASCPQWKCCQNLVLLGYVASRVAGLFTYAAILLYCLPNCLECLLVLRLTIRLCR
jgi:hypothetical protein